MLLWPSSASGQGCAPRETWLSHLAKTYGETLAMQGISSRGTEMIEVTVNPDDGSFTIIISNTDGMSCGLAAGKDWREVAPETDDPKT